ncbi:hypothetical protein [Gracilimonas tropica]|uniref:hypothetical protein n=1 Tax=Gracilimonas tropica TaxID=454600 RepID=UPI00036C4D79|nr:hypothetical protein [Gracilimonas tropica]
MKKALLPLLALFFTTAVFAQDSTSITKSDDYELTKLLNELVVLENYKTDDLSIRIFKVGNASGSAGFASGEISHLLYITTSEFDEAPEQHLFTVGPFLNPEIDTISETNSGVQLKVFSGKYDERFIKTYMVSLRNIEEQKP